MTRKTAESLRTERRIRDSRMLEMRAAGETYKAIGSRFGISAVRASYRIAKEVAARKTGGAWESRRGTGTAEADDLIDDMPLSLRTRNAMRNEGIRTAGEAVARSEKDLLRIPNFGRTSLAEIRRLVPGAGSARNEAKPEAPKPGKTSGDRITPIQAALLATALEETLGDCPTHDSWRSALDAASRKGGWFAVTAQSGQDVKRLLEVAAGIGVEFIVKVAEPAGQPPGAPSGDGGPDPAAFKGAQGGRGR